MHHVTARRIAAVANATTTATVVAAMLTFIGMVAVAKVAPAATGALMPMALASLGLLLTGVATAIAGAVAQRYT